MARKGKATSRKVRDKWKAKEWYKLYAPRMFNGIEIGETPSSDPEFLMGRTAEVTVHDLTGDFSKMHVKLRFQVNDVEGYDARTVFVGHDLTSDYVRRLTRRKRTKTDNVVDVTTKDGYRIRVKPMGIAEKRIQSSQESAIRAIMANEIKDRASNLTVSEFIKAIISGDMAKGIAVACKAIVPVKRVEIRKTEILEFGEVEAEPMFEPEPEPEEVPEVEASEGEAEVIEEEIPEETEVVEAAEVIEEEIPEETEVVEATAEEELPEEETSE